MSKTDHVPTGTSIAPFSYADSTTPVGYKCAVCGALGVRLYRQYQTFANQIRLHCRECALADQKQKGTDDVTEHSIGWLVAAVPTVEGDTFWGFTSVPDDGVKWWDRLPRN